MKVLTACVRKDLCEFLRGRKNIICMVILLAICAMVLLVTKTMPALLAELSVKSPNLVSDPTAMDGMLAKMFPAHVRGSLGIVASDIGVFYTIAVALLCHAILPAEIHAGKWIVPLNACIPARDLLASKCLVYAAGMAFPVFVVMNLYYFAASFFLENNAGWDVALICSLVMAFAVACIVAVTILASVLVKHSIIAALSVILVVATAPDILTLFSFGKWFPTYLLTFAYNAESNITAVLIPALLMLLIVVGLFVWADRKLKQIELTR